MESKMDSRASRSRTVLPEHLQVVWVPRKLQDRVGGSHLRLHVLLVQHLRARRQGGRGRKLGMKAGCNGRDLHVVVDVVHGGFLGGSGGDRGRGFLHHLEYLLHGCLAPLHATNTVVLLKFALLQLVEELLNKAQLRAWDQATLFEDFGRCGLDVGVLVEGAQANPEEKTRMPARKNE